MRKIRNEVYENLPPEKRVVALIEAMAREDEFERKRLFNTCPMVTCQQTDPRFTRTMDRLMGLAMAVEADLKEAALRYFVSLRLDPEGCSQHLQSFANTRYAWLATLDALGINECSMSMAGPPSSPVFALLADFLPEPAVDESNAMSAAMLNSLGR